MTGEVPRIGVAAVLIVVAVLAGCLGTGGTAETDAPTVNATSYLGTLQDSQKISGSTMMELQQKIQQVQATNETSLGEIRRTAHESNRTAVTEALDREHVLALTVYTERQLNTSTIEELRGYGIDISQGSFIPGSDGGSYHAMAPMTELHRLVALSAVRSLTSPSTETTTSSMG